MRPKPVEILQAHVADLPAPRPLRSEAHPPIHILCIAQRAVLCGAGHFTAMEAFGQAKGPWFSQHLDRCRGIPSHGIFNRVFRLLDPGAFCRRFGSWSRALAALTAGEGVALDGKSVRRAFDQAAGADQP